MSLAKSRLPSDISNLLKFEHKSLSKEHELYYHAGKKASVIVDFSSFTWITVYTQDKSPLYFNSFDKLHTWLTTNIDLF